MKLFNDLIEISKKKRQLINALIALTDNCNLNCKHCYLSPQQKKLLTYKEITDIVVQLKRMDCLFLNFTGGEIFTREDTTRIIEFSAKHKFSINLLTNGTLINRDIARFLKRNFIASVFLSLYGSQSSMHDNFTRQEGSFEKTMNAITCLKRERQNFRVNYVMTKYNVNDVPRMKKLQNSMKIEVFYSAAIMPKEDGTFLEEDMLISKEDLKRFFALDHIRNSKKSRLNKKDFYKPVCGAWLNKCYISEYGEVRPCVGYPLQYSVGDLKKEKLRDIWNKIVYLNDIKLEEITANDFKVCNQCLSVEFCALCPAHSILESGELGPVQQKCMMASAKSEFKKLIKRRRHGEQKT